MYLCTSLNEAESLLRDGDDVLCSEYGFTEQFSMQL